MLENKSEQKQDESYLGAHEAEIALKMKNTAGYFFIQDSSNGRFDYAFYDDAFKEIDAGIYEASNRTIQEVAAQVLLEVKGLPVSVCEVIDCAEFLETVDRAEYFPQKTNEALKEHMESGKDEVAFQCGYGYYAIQKTSEGYDYIAYDDQWQEIGGNSYEEPDASLEEVISWIFQDERCGSLECKPLDYREVVRGTIQSAKMRLSEENLTPTSEIGRREKALGGLSRHDIERTVLHIASLALEDSGVDQDVKLLAARVYGSRTREGLYRDNSDIDVVLSYSGDLREDDFFNILHEHSITIAGMTVDINPISREKTGTLEAYMERAETYLDQRENNKLLIPHQQDRDKSTKKSAHKGVGERQSVLQALRSRQAKQKAQEKSGEPKKAHTHKKGEQEL